MPESAQRLTITEHPGLTAEEAAGLLADDGAVGFSYSPRAAQFMVRRDGSWRTARQTSRSAAAFAESTADLTDVFELCCFTADREVRWTQHRAGKGTAYVRSEAPFESGPTPFGQPSAHLIWGQVNAGRDVPAGWTSTESGRVGPVLVPTTTKSTSRDHLYILSQEYSDTDDQGNIFIADVRYIGLSATMRDGGNTHG